MDKIGSKKALEVELSRLEGFHKSKVRAEQYITPSDIAAEVLWKALLNGDIKGKVAADLGCGTGILGIGCLLLGARRVFFVESDSEALEICRRNIGKIESRRFNARRAEIIEKDISEFDKVSGGAVNTVVMNPPFGTRKRHADRGFLLKAFSISDAVYSFHKSSTRDYIEQLGGKNGFKAEERFDFRYVLGNTMVHHMKRRQHIDASCFVFRKHSQAGNDNLSTGEKP
ncbi:methyltransferase [Candidatus Woesearchaeota archaeon]|nr:methyltransferase [Candidatus Woesearchaeota archaeon]